MSDHLHLSSPASPSPGRTPAILRPAWPWQALPRRASGPSSLENRSSLNPSRPTSNPAIHSNTANPLSWRPTSASAGVTMPANHSFGNNNQEDSTRQWTFMGFEWTVRNVQKLRDFVEGNDLTDVENADGCDFEILKESPMLGDNKFKLEIAFTPTDGSSDATNSTNKRSLSLYITSLMVDFAHTEYDLSASMMAAIKCPIDRAGERGSPPQWVWEFWQTDWVFRQEHEVWECPLPSLSSLLENVKIRESDSFVICVQIHSPSGPNYPQQPAVHSIPRDLLDGLEASLDNANTGDVRFICFERLTVGNEPTSPFHSPETSTENRQPSLPASSYSPFSPETTARKRVIYAHSDILVRRSEYFATMLNSPFSENQSLKMGEEKIHNIVVEEADFETMYWLLKFCYTNWLLFREDDDPRLAISGIEVGWSAKQMHAQGREWDWKTFPRDENSMSDVRSVTSGDSLHSNLEPKQTSSTSNSLQTVTVSQSPVTSGNSIPTTSKINPSASPVRQAGPSRKMTSVSGQATSSSARTKPIPVLVPPANFVSPTRSGFPISPRGNKQHSSTLSSAPDPHPHPTSAPKPASALSIYQVAHRYAMPGLATLALEHMMSTITSQSCFALLLASSIWEELHSLVEDYVVEKWDAVSTSQGFEQCCQEVAAGEWGPDGGKTLMSIFRRLRSPCAINNVGYREN